MTRPDLNTREWRDLPRDGECVAEFLFGEAAGDCHGLMHRHHVRPRDPRSRTYLVCARHHPTIEAFLRNLGRRNGYQRIMRRHNGCTTCDGHRMVQVTDHPEVWARCPDCNAAPARREPALV
jgi:hypothetical protein